ncbi:uncharacterized protein LOC129964046 isoform X1 [Argiope bruennichi]|uniref:uncharacterized protein LOC129964046 isoform X1 n=1 Tax=Argiope bruennichi TaxID=94029 RepID=UPI0024950C20|nr:uncharacterized protein LOC129964046 isoform X1 [Argiope bruennichi]
MDLGYYYTNRKRSGPDQGYAWVVAIACFFINFLLVGIARSVAVLYVALVETYGITRQQATLPFSIRVALRNLSGPLIGLLGLKYGIRAVTAVGGFVAAIGSILCYFAPDVIWITVFWGLIHGIGFGLSTVIHMMIINQYFDKYKASALGLGYSGDCFGTFAFPVIMEYLLSTYGVKGTFLILGGIVFNVIPMALLLKKPPWIENTKKSGNFSKNIAQENSKEIKPFKEPTRESVGYRNEGFLNLDEDLAPYDSIAMQNGKSRSIKQEDDAPPVYQDVVKTNLRIGSIKQDISSISGSLRSHRKPSEISEIIRESMVRHDSLPPVFEKESLPSDSNHSENCDDVQTTIQGNNHDEERGKGLQYSASMKKRTSSFVGQMAQDIVHRMRSASFASQVAQDGFITSIEPQQNEDFDSQPEEFSGIVCQQVQTDKQIEKIRADSIRGELIIPPNNQDSSNGTKDQTYSYWAIQVKETKKPTILKSLLKTNMKPIFVLISISMAVYAFLFVGVLTIIIDYAVDQGVSHDDGKFLIIGFSVADLIGRLSFGQVIDRKLVKIKNYSGMTMLLMGTLVASLPFNKSFNFMLVCMCLYGLVQGGTAIMFPILVGHYMDKSEESVAMGCLNFYGGLLMLCMAPMIGYFRDNTGSYNGVFHILGGLVAFVGLIWQLEPVILKFQRKQMLKKANYIIVTKL